MESFRALSYHLIRQCFIHQERLGLPDSYYHKFMFALCGCSHNCACVSKLPPLIMLHPRTARRYAQIYAEFFIKNFCIQFFKVAREATVPAAPYYILTIVTEHFADADTQTESSFTIIIKALATIIRLPLHLHYLHMDGTDSKIFQ